MRKIWLLVVTMGVFACGSDAARPLVVRSGGEWERLADSPLSPRASTVGVWTGDELLVIGGTTFRCPPTADCAEPKEPPLSDGAALDLESSRWRSIAPAPLPVLSATSALVGGDVYLLATTDYRGRTAFLRYRINGDQWDHLPSPGEPGAWYGIVAAGGQVVAYATSHEQELAPDLVFGQTTEEWSELPASPLTPGFDRTMVWSSPHLYLFDRELVASPGSERPALARAARLEWSSSTWQRLPDSEMLDTGPWLVEEDQLTVPTLGAADGGEVNNWGRTYANGGTFDLATDRWAELPPTDETVTAAGAVGETTALYLAPGGQLLDTRLGRWIMMPTIPEQPHAQRTLLVAGRAAVTFGGVDWSRAGALLSDAWLWQPSG